MFGSMMIFALSVSASATATPICNDHGKAQPSASIHSQWQDQREQAEWQQLMLQRGLDNQRHMNDRLQQLQWETDKVRQETEDQQTQLMLHDQH